MKKIITWSIRLSMLAALLIASSFLWSRIYNDHINPNLIVRLENYCKRNNLSEKYCIIVDFSIYSGKERLFIVDLECNEIFYSSLCAHGIGKDLDCIFTPKFSNEKGSYYSCLGHFKIGMKRKTTQYDLNCYELHGLDASNSNAYSRGILIHDGMPDIRVLGLPCLPLSQGCFTITSNAFKKINELRSKCDKPLLIYSTDNSIF